MEETLVDDTELPAGSLTDIEVTPIPAASAIVLREASSLEVLMIRRPVRSSFAPNVWVFPGGAAESIDSQLAAELASGSFVDTMRMTALRETFEETGIWLGAALA